MCPWFFTSCVAWIVFFLNGLCLKLSFLSFGICSAADCPFTLLLYWCRGIIAKWLMPLRATIYLLGSLGSSVFPCPEQGWSGWRGVWEMRKGAGTWQESSFASFLLFVLIETAPQEHASFINFAISAGSTCTSHTDLSPPGSAPRGLLLSLWFENTIWTRNDPVTLAKN